MDELVIFTKDSFTNSSIETLSDQIITWAITHNISDIHFEIYQDFCRIRLRKDGMLKEFKRIDKRDFTKLISRLKVMAKMDIAKTRVPQDGSIKYRQKNRNVNIRVSSCPTVYGEKVVLRILENETTLRTISQLGLDTEQESLLLTAIAKNEGLILVTGPTGSGKTVTLYASLKHLNRITKNIVTVEDPVEIYLPGINQVNINLDANLSFANILRNFLRQDPDIIMVGEIRDEESAEIAIHAAQTGHLVLSTLHTNCALDTLIRLSNMGIYSYNIASSIALIIAQRLLRKLCPFCKERDNNIYPYLKKFGIIQKQKIYRHKGCARCNMGYTDRIAIFELLPGNEGLFSYILKDYSDPVLKNRILGQYRSLKMSGLEKVAQGETDVDELIRVIGNL